MCVEKYPADILYCEMYFVCCSAQQVVALSVKPGIIIFNAGSQGNIVLSQSCFDVNIHFLPLDLAYICTYVCDVM